MRAPHCMKLRDWCMSHDWSEWEIAYFWGVPVKRTLVVLVMLASFLVGCTSAQTGAGGQPAAVTASGATTRAAGSTGLVMPAGTPLPVPSYAQPSQSGQYLVGPLDQLTVTVFQVPELSGPFQVGSDGVLTLPLIGGVAAGGRTAADIQKEITEKLAANYMRAPQVVVQVSGFNSQKVTVDGAVNKPGVFPVSSSATLLDYIALAGGTPRVADEANVVVFRVVDGKRMGARFNLSQIRDGTSINPVVYGGDTIIVPTSGIRSAFTDIISAMPLATFAATATGL